MKHLLHTTVLLLVTIVVSDELDVQVEREGPKAEHDSEGDLDRGHVDNYENSGPSRRERQE